MTTGCDGETEILVRAAWEDGRPVPELDITALPFDPDRLLDSLAAIAPNPRPSFTELEQELRAYARPTDDPYEELNRPWRALRDSVVALSDSLFATDREAPHYAAMYERFRRSYARLADRAAERDAAMRQLGASDLGLARRAQAAADSLRRWEYEAYEGYADAAAAAIAHAGARVVETSTDGEGRAVLGVEPGRWWLVARLPDPDNPFLEYYWSVAVTVTRLVPVRIPMDPGTGERRWQH
ncbi:MAG: hypothetical protein OEO20_14290 [Gemmatimonadota bacterium]|nr:hypothetical protein [Gemmatimonadota bacterium]MDH3367299.1 hypothetical protein [Gemmatimonadota bacterium]MDH3479462.1 hypothetical protein [Gemmatimonadota bacterium]MDH5549105.1 hypothetical protein [Gemmatimonadota bacterium]